MNKKAAPIIGLIVLLGIFTIAIKVYRKDHTVAICGSGANDTYKIFLSSSKLVRPHGKTVHCKHIKTSKEDYYLCPIGTMKKDKVKLVVYEIYDNNTKTFYAGYGFNNLSLLSQNNYSNINMNYAGLSLICGLTNGTIKKNLLSGYTLCITPSLASCKIKVEW